MTATVPMYYVLWRRPERRVPWEMVNTFVSEREAIAAMRGAGDYQILPAGQEP